MKDRLRTFRPGDFAVFALVLLLAAAVAAPFFFVPQGALYLEVRQDQQLVRRVRLADGVQETFTVEGRAGGHNTIEIDGRRVRIREADCHDQVCVRTGWLTRAGQSAVCLPNRLVVKLTGQKASGDVDAIVR